MNPEDLMRKYKYGYMFSKDLLEIQFVKDLLKENKKLQEENKKLKEKMKKIIKCIKNQYYEKEYRTKGTFANKLMIILVDKEY